MNPQLGRRLWILGALLLVLDLVVLFNFGFGVVGYAFAFVTGLVPLILGVWCTVSWLNARDRRQ